MKFEITPKFKQLVKTISYLLLEIVLLSYYADSTTTNTNISELSHYRGLSVAGSIFMMISFLLIVVLHYKFSRYLMYFLLVFMPFAVFLILIGMGLSQTSTYYQDQYKFPVAYWFIELMLLLLGFLVIHEVKVSNPEQGNPNQAPKKQQQKYEVPGNANI